MGTQGDPAAAGNSSTAPESSGEAEFSPADLHEQPSAAGDEAALRDRLGTTLGGLRNIASSMIEEMRKVSRVEVSNPEKGERSLAMVVVKAPCVNYVLSPEERGTRGSRLVRVLREVLEYPNPSLREILAKLSELPLERTESLLATLAQKMQEFERVATTWASENFEGEEGEIPQEEFDRLWSGMPPEKEYMGVLGEELYRRTRVHLDELRRKEQSSLVFLQPSVSTPEGKDAKDLVAEADSSLATSTAANEASVAAPDDAGRGQYVSYRSSDGGFTLDLAIAGDMTTASEGVRKTLEELLGAISEQEVDSTPSAPAEERSLLELVQSVVPEIVARTNGGPGDAELRSDALAILPLAREVSGRSQLGLMDIEQLLKNTPRWENRKGTPLAALTALEFLEEVWLPLVRKGLRLRELNRFDHKLAKAAGLTLYRQGRTLSDVIPSRQPRL